MFCLYRLNLHSNFIQDKENNSERYFSIITRTFMYNIKDFYVRINQRLPGACNRSSGSNLLSITTQLHCGGHLGGRARLPDTILEEDHPMTIPSKFGSN